jgi:hypothetical protein
MVHLRAERVFILEYYFASTSFAVSSEAFSTAYPDKEAPNKIIIHLLVAKFQDTGNIYEKCSSRDKRMK